MGSSSPVSKGVVANIPVIQGRAPPPAQRGHQMLEHESLLAKQWETMLKDEDKSNSCAVIQKIASFFFKITCFNKVETLCQLNHLIICKNDESKQ